MSNSSSRSSEARQMPALTATFRRHARRTLTAVFVTGLLGVLAPSLASASVAKPGHAVRAKARHCRKGFHHVVRGRHSHRHLVCVKNRRHTPRPPADPPTNIPGPPTSIPGPPPGPPPHSADAAVGAHTSSARVGGIDASTTGTWTCYDGTVSVSSDTLGSMQGDGVYAYPYVYDYRAPGGAGWYSGLWIQASSIYAVTFSGIGQPDLTGWVVYARNVNGQWQYNGEWYSISDSLDSGFC